MVVENNEKNNKQAMFLFGAHIGHRGVVSILGGESYSCLAAVWPDILFKVLHETPSGERKHQQKHGCSSRLPPF